MPQRSLHPLVYILLIWISILTILLPVFITLSLSLRQSSNNCTLGCPAPLNYPVCSSELLNLQAKASEGPQKTIEWTMKQDNSTLISEKPLRIIKDGNYILNLRVTLSSCSDQVVLHNVALVLANKQRDWTSIKTNSTGLLSKVLRLAAGDKLEITIEPPGCVDIREEVTHLDMVWLQSLKL